jgi:type II secretory pathway pseudopilin PulG
VLGIREAFEATLRNFSKRIGIFGKRVIFVRIVKSRRKRDPRLLGFRVTQYPRGYGQKSHFRAKCILPIKWVVCDVKSSFNRCRPNVGVSAFTLMEVVISMGVVGILIVGLYAAIGSSFNLVRISQENQRVTQILSDKLDTIRLYNWSQLNSNGFIPTNFVVPIDPLDPASAPYYTGRVSITHSTMSTPYRSNLLHISVTINWVSGSRPQSRTMTTYVAKYGLQSYIMR